MQSPCEQPNVAAAAGERWSMLMLLVTPRVHTLCDGDDGGLVWKMAAAAAEHVEDTDQQVFTTPITRRRAQAPTYCLS